MIVGHLFSLKHTSNLRELDKAAHDMAMETVTSGDASSGLGAGTAKLEPMVDLGKIIYRGDKFFWRWEERRREKDLLWVALSSCRWRFGNPSTVLLLLLRLIFVFFCCLCSCAGMMAVHDGVVPWVRIETCQVFCCLENYTPVKGLTTNIVSFWLTLEVPRRRSTQCPPALLGSSFLSHPGRRI